MYHTISDASNSNNPVIDTLVPLIPCNESVRLLSLNKTINVNTLFYGPIYYYYCLPDHLQDIPLRNSWGQSFFHVYKIFIGLKNLNKELLDELGLVYYHILSTNNYFDGSKVDPTNRIVDSQLITSGANIKKDINYFYNLISYITDNGVIFENFENNESYNLGSITIDTNLRGPDNLIFYLKLSLNKIKLIYNRRYTKFQDVLAKIGGINKSIFSIAWMFAYLFRYVYIEEMILPFFVKNNKFMEKMIQNIKFSSPKTNSFILSKGNTSYSYPVKNIKIRDSCFKKMTCRSQKLKDTEAQYKKAINFVSILNLVFDMKKLKTIIFSKEQLFIFENLITSTNCSLKKNENYEDLNKIYNKVKTGEDPISKNMVFLIDKALVK
jgi:hypothetical protein